MYYMTPEQARCELIDCIQSYIRDEVCDGDEDQAIEETERFVQAHSKLISKTVSDVCKENDTVYIQEFMGKIVAKIEKFFDLD